MKTLNLECLTAQLQYVPPVEEACEEVFKPTSILVIPVTTAHDEDVAIIKSCLDKADLIIENSFNKKRLTSEHAYFIVGEHAGVFKAEQQLPSKLSLEAVQAALSSGKHIARRFSHDDYRIAMSPTDLDGLHIYKDYRRAWSEVVAAVANCDIETFCHWSTRGANIAALSNLVGNDLISYNGVDVTMSQFAEDCVKRRMEYLFNEVFSFCVDDRSAFYHASVAPQGLQISKYADVRAFIYYHEDMERRRLRDLEIEEGLHSV